MARWDNGEIAEENLVYDVGGLMRQIGLGTVLWSSTYSSAAVLPLGTPLLDAAIPNMTGPGTIPTTPSA